MTSSITPITPIAPIAPIASVTSITPEIHAGIAHLKRIFMPGDTINITFLHSVNKYPNGSAYEEHDAGLLEEIATPEKMAEYKKKNDDGWHVYLAMNPLQTGKKNRLKLYVAGDHLRTLFTEFDHDVAARMKKVRDAINAGIIPEPNIVVESSRSVKEGQKRQLVWLIDESTFDVEKVEAVNKAMAKMFGGDRQSTDVLRLLRLPGFENKKPAYAPNFPTVRVVKEYVDPFDDRYRFEDFKIEAEPEVRRPAAEKINDAFIAYRVEALDNSAIELGLTKDNVSWKDWTAKNGEHANLLDMNCPWAHLHTSGPGGASLTVFDGGGMDFGCLHDHCVDKHYADYVALYKERTGKDLDPISPAEHMANLQKNLPIMGGEKMKLEPPTNTTNEAGRVAPSAAPAAAPAAQKLERWNLRPMNSFSLERVRWFWKNRIIANMPNVFFGEPGMGKGFVALDFIARMTTGAGFADGPNANPPCDAIICTTEDSISMTVLPRLKLAGADINRIHVLEITIEEGETKKERLLRLDEDLEKLAKICKSNPAIKIIYIDLLATYMGNADSIKDKDVRPIYTQMAVFAEEHDICFLLIAHPNKNQQASAVNRLSGAKSLASVFRNVWIVEKDPEDKKFRLLMPVKTNLADDTKRSLRYHIESKELDYLDGKEPGFIGKLAWDGETDHDADEVLQGLGGYTDKKKTKERQSAVDFLTEFLKDGPQSGTAVKRAAAIKGIKWRALQVASRILTVQKRNMFGEWQWANTDAELDKLESEHKGKWSPETAARDAIASGKLRKRKRDRKGKKPEQTDLGLEPAQPGVSGDDGLSDPE